MGKAQKKENGLPLFIEKLIQILEDEEVSEIIRWTSTADSFHILNMTRFIEFVLPKYFKHNNASSFVRQLNMYGFKKIRHEDGDIVYTHQFLKKGETELLSLIKRKLNKDKEEKLVLYQGSNSLPMKDKIENLQNRQKDLEQVCKHLLFQNKKLIEENNKLMDKFKHQNNSKETQMEEILLSYLINLHGTKEVENKLDLLSIQPEENQKVNNNEQNDPWEVLSGVIMKGKDMKKVKKMLEGMHRPNEIGTKSYTIMEDSPRSQREQEPGEMQNEMIAEDNHSEHSFLSVNDFLNVDSRQEDTERE